MCNEGHWRAIDSYGKDIDQPVSRGGRVVLEQCTECFDYREVDVKTIRSNMDE